MTDSFLAFESSSAGGGGSTTTDDDPTTEVETQQTMSGFLSRSSTTWDDSQQVQSQQTPNVNLQTASVLPTSFNLGQQADTLANIADTAAGSTDESIARSSDNTKGGGWWTGTNEAVSGTSNVVLDSDDSRFSVQEAAQFTLTGTAETVGKVFGGDTQVSDEELSRDISAAAAESKQRFNTTFQKAGDEPETQTLGWLGENLVASPAKGLFRGSTGLSVDKKAQTEGNLDAGTAADIALSAIGLKAGKAGVSALRSSDEIAAGLRSGDDGGSILSRVTSSDDGTTADDGIEFGDAKPNTGGNLNNSPADFTDLHSGDEITVSDDTPTSTADDSEASSTIEEMFGDTSPSTGDDLTFRDAEPNTGGTRTADDWATRRGNSISVSDDAAQTADDGTTGTGTPDESTSLLDDVTTRLSRGDETEDAADAANVSEDAATDSPSLANALFGTPLRAGATTATTLFGANVATELNIGNWTQPDQKQYTTADGDVLEQVDMLPPNSKAPDGAVAYRVYTEDGTPKGYTAVLGERNGKIQYLGPNGKPRTSKVADKKWDKAQQRRRPAPARQQGGGN